VANIYKNAKVDLTTTELQLLYTVPSNSRAIVKSLLKIWRLKKKDQVAYTMINGKKVPVVKCETEVVLRNTRN